MLPVDVPVVEGHFRVIPLLGSGSQLGGFETRHRAVARHARRGPQLGQLLGGELVLQPGVVLSGELVVVVGRRRAEPDAEAVLVQDLDNRDGRLVAVLGLGIRVDVCEKLLRILFLQLDQARVEQGKALAPSDLVEILRAVPGLVGAAHVEVQVRIDAALLEFGDFEIQAIELLRIE